MDYKSIQKKIFDKLINLKRVAYSDFNDDSVIITPDGYMAYVIPKKLLFIDLSKVPTIQGVAKYFERSEDDVELKLTCDLHSGNKTLRKLSAANFNIWVNDSFLKEFQYCKFFGNNPLNRVLVETQSGVPVGMVLPVRHTEVEDKP